MNKGPHGIKGFELSTEALDIPTRFDTVGMGESEVRLLLVFKNLKGVNAVKCDPKLIETYVGKFNHQPTHSVVVNDDSTLSVHGGLQAAKNECNERNARANTLDIAAVYSVNTL